MFLSASKKKIILSGRGGVVPLTTEEAKMQKLQTGLHATIISERLVICGYAP